MSNVLTRALSMGLSASSGMSLLAIKKWLGQLPSLGCRDNLRCQLLILSTALCVLVLLASTSEMSAKEAHTGEDTIVLGMSTALTGPTSILGLNMRAGVLAAIDEVNRAGGINGHELSLVSLDDGYEPSRTAPNMRRLVHEEQVSAIIGNVGTPTAVAAIPIANASKTPFVGAFTGAGVLRKTPPDRYVINYRASYAEETMAMVDALITHGGLKPSEIAFFTQRDAYGDAGFSGGISALKHHGLKDENAVIHSRYERNTLAVENGLADIIMSNPQPKAVIMVGAYAPCSAFILLAKQSGLKAMFLNVSFVGAEPLAEHLGQYGDGVIVTQVVPHFDVDLPMVSEYRKAIQSWNSWTVPTFGSLEGYIAAQILFRALRTIEGTITKETIVNALEGLGEFDMGLGEPLRLGPDEHQACHRVWPTVLDGGKAVPLEWKELTAKFGGIWHE